jgi:hypothetical protein
MRKMLPRLDGPSTVEQLHKGANNNCNDGLDENFSKKFHRQFFVRFSFPPEFNIWGFSLNSLIFDYNLNIGTFFDYIFEAKIFGSTNQIDFQMLRP